VVLSGNTSVSNLSISSSFRIRKRIGRGYSSWSSHGFGLPSPTHPSSSTLLVFVPWVGYTYTLSPLSAFSAGTLLLPFPRSIFGGYIKARIGYARPFGRRSCHFGTPSGDPSSVSPPSTFPSCHRAPLRAPASIWCAGPYSHFLAQASTRHLSDVNFLCQGSIHSLCFYICVVDVTKGSPLFPACFFPFYFLWMYEYVGRIWFSDRRDVRLVSYQRELGVWMFLRVRRVLFLLAIALNLNAVFVPSSFLLFYF